MQTLRIPFVKKISMIYFYSGMILTWNCNYFILADFPVECRLVMHFTQEYGVSIYAGKNIEEGELIEHVIGIPVPINSINRTALEDYCEGYNSTHKLVTLGYAMLYNHASPKDDLMLETLIADTESLAFHEPFGMSSDVFYQATRKIYEGEQIFNNYGDLWFKSRGLQGFAPNSDVGGQFCKLENPHNHNTRIPGCPHAVLSFKNNRLYAKNDLRSGEYVEVSRLLRLEEKYLHNSGPIEQLVWRGADQYFLSRQLNEEAGENIAGSNHPQSSTKSHQYVLLLLGYGALYQSPEIQGEAATLSYSWWTEECLPGGMLSKGDKGSEAADTGLKVPSVGFTYHNYQDPWSGARCTGNWYKTCDWSPLKAQCTSRMFISFQASRDILAGEELTVDLRVDPLTRSRFTRPEFPQECFQSI